MDTAILARSCAVCDAAENLNLCGVCRLVRYCSREHQASDRASHKRACNAVKKTSDDLAHEEQVLRSAPADTSMPPDVFNTSVGKFWTIVGTRDYLRARYFLAEAMLKLKTPEATRAALDHLWDMLRLSRPDNIGARNLACHLMIRLDRDQDAYDLVKWWCTTANRIDYDWGDPSLPYLDIHGADVFEPVDYLCARLFITLTDLSAMTLIKIRLLIDLKNLQSSIMSRQQVDDDKPEKPAPQYTPRSRIISENAAIMSSAEHSDRIRLLESQVDALYKAVIKNNKHFWPALLSPNGINTRPSMWVDGTPQEAALVLGFSLDAWRETPGALDVIRAKRSGKSARVG